MGGAVNAMAGGAKLFVFPMLLAAGMPPVAANITGTVALWPAVAPAIWVYRDRIRRDWRTLLLGAAPALAGAALGALGLILSDDATFMAMVPAILAVALTAILFGDQLAAWGRRSGFASRWGVLALLLISGLYGGFFGAGLGFLLMAAFTLAGADDPQDANARKVLYATLINTTAVIPLAFTGLVDWRAAALVAAGGMVGGYGGAHLTRLLPRRPMRWAVALLGTGLTLSFILG